MPHTRTPNPTDAHVGQRIRMRRKMLHMSQTDLAVRLKLTFQQIQKYENGSNRVGAGRLADIAAILQVPVAFFFEGQQGKTPVVAIDGSALDLTAFLATSEGLALITNFTAIKNPKLRHAIIGMAKAAAHPGGGVVERKAA